MKGGVNKEWDTIHKNTQPMPGVFLSVFELHNQHFPTQRLRKWLSPISRLEELKSGGVPLGQVHITMPNESASVLAQRSKEVAVAMDISDTRNCQLNKPVSLPVNSSSYYQIEATSLPHHLWLVS